jgi:hypothetical protein
MLVECMLAVRTVNEVFDTGRLQSSFELFSGGESTLSGPGSGPDGKVMTMLVCAIGR